MSSTVTEGEGTTAARPARTSDPSHWCHQCHTAITPIMGTPHPKCQSCNSELVEEIENDNHPGGAGDGSGGMRFIFENRSGVRMETSSNFPGGDELAAALEIMLQHSIGGPSPQPESSDNPNENAGGAQPAPIRTQTRTDPGVGTPEVSIVVPRGSTLAGYFDHAFGIAREGGDGGATATTGGGYWVPEGSSLEAALDEYVAAMEDGGGGATAATGGGGAPFDFSSLVGNPDDYAFNESELDNFITTLMEEQQSQKRPPPATEHVIDALPRQIIREVLVGYECAVCKDDYSIDDICIRLPCRHTFHDACIRPWLHVNGTCPTCRYSLIHSRPAFEANSSTAQSATTAGSSATSVTRRRVDSPRPGRLYS